MTCGTPCEKVSSTTDEVDFALRTAEAEYASGDRVDGMSSSVTTRSAIYDPPAPARQQAAEDNVILPSPELAKGVGRDQDGLYNGPALKP